MFHWPFFWQPISNTNKTYSRRSAPKMASSTLQKHNVLKGKWTILTRKLLHDRGKTPKGQMVPFARMYTPPPSISIKTDRPPPPRPHTRRPRPFPMPRMRKKKYRHVRQDDKVFFSSSPSIWGESLEQKAKRTNGSIFTHVHPLVLGSSFHREYKIPPPWKITQ